NICLELGPELICAVQQRHVSGMLEVGLADDARLSVRTAAVVRDRKLLDPENALATAGQGIKRGAAHSPDADHDRIEIFHRRAASVCDFGMSTTTFARHLASRRRSSQSRGQTGIAGPVADGPAEELRCKHPRDRINNRLFNSMLETIPGFGRIRRMHS